MVDGMFELPVVGFWVEDVLPLDPVVDPFDPVVDPLDEVEASLEVAETPVVVTGAGGGTHSSADKVVLALPISSHGSALKL